jgi:hypothetical protein
MKLFATVAAALALSKLNLEKSNTSATPNKTYYIPDTPNDSNVYISEQNNLPKNKHGFTNDELEQYRALDKRGRKAFLQQRGANG